MNIKQYPSTISLRIALITTATIGFSEAQTIFAGSNIDMQGVGYIYAAPTLEGGLTDYLLEVATMMAPISQFTGLKEDGTEVAYYDLLPLKASSLQIVTGAGAYAPTGTAVVIDGSGIETNALSILDGTSNTPAPLTVQNGVLSVNHSPVLTQESANDAGFVTSYNLWWHVSDQLHYNSVSLAGGSSYGGSSTAMSSGWASGDYSTAISFGWANADYSTAMSSGWTDAEYSTAMSGGYAAGYSSTAMSGAAATGYSSTATSGGSATGFFSTAMSFGSASGAYSTASGDSVTAASFSSTSFGTYNDPMTASPDFWVETDPVLLVGNGGYDTAGNWTGQTSNALAVLKNGKTTLTNKAWKADPGVEPTQENSQGEALVVEGHTRLAGNTTLEGKIIIAQPQGDISMGDYQ